MRRIISFVFVALAIATHVVAADPTPIHVVIIHDARVPSLSDAQTQQVLHRTEHLIKTICQRDVRFVIDQRVENIPFFNSLAARIAPYDPAKTDTINPFAVDRNAWRKPIRQSLDRVADLNTIRAMVPGHHDMPTIDDVVDVLCEFYAQSIEQLKALKADDGSPLLNTDNWPRYNMACWGIYLHSLDWSNDYTLYFSNSFLIDTTITATQPTAIPRGAATNYFDLPASRAAMVSRITQSGPAKVRRFSQPWRNSPTTRNSTPSRMSPHRLSVVTCFWVIRHRISRAWA